MLNGPLVSVIIPCFNVAPYIKQSLLSVTEQSYRNLEIIVIDDASTDDSLSIIRNFKDSRIKIIELKENTKKIGAVNLALKLVRGEFIAFQDADDISDLSRIEKQVTAFIHDRDLDVCFTNYRLNKEYNKLRKIALSDHQLKDEFFNYGHRKYSDLDPTMCATMMIRRHVLDVCPGYHPYFTSRVAEDTYWVYCILKIFKGVALSAPLYLINQRSGSLTDNQIKGNNAKAAYTWKLLSRIILKDQTEGIDVLADDNQELLKELELQACEEALVNQIKYCNKLKQTYESSASFRIGRTVLAPLRFFRMFNNKANR